MKYLFPAFFLCLAGCAVSQFSKIEKTPVSVTGQSSVATPQEGVNFYGEIIDLHGLESALLSWQDRIKSNGYETIWKLGDSVEASISLRTDPSKDTTYIGFSGCNGQGAAYAGVSEFKFIESYPPTVKFCLVGVLDDSGKPSWEAIDHSKGAVADNMFTAISPSIHGYKISEDGQVLSLLDQNDIALVVAKKGAQQ